MKHAATLATGTLLASVASGQVVQWDIAKRGGSKGINKRADSIQQTIDNNRNLGGYFADCTVGSNSQKVTLQLDTGSSDIWVPSSQACGASSSSSDNENDETIAENCPLGYFDDTTSDTFNVINNDFDIQYVDGTGSSGDYISETFGIGGATLSNLTMGLALKTTIQYGLVGVGYTSNEASLATGETYPNLPVVMRQEGKINTNAYSLWLNDLGASTGSILFGGIDTDKYMGDLIRINTQVDPQTRTVSSFIVELSSVSAHSSSGEDGLSTSYPVPVVLDSGTTFSYLPTDLAQQIWEEVGAEYTIVSSQGDGAPLVPCTFADHSGYFSFQFGGSGGPVINVTLDELVVPLVSSGSVQFPSGQYKGQDICQFGIQNFSSDPFLLGDTFLRSAYVVYDLENNEIAMAPTDFNATSSNVIAFASRGATIPSSTAAPNQQDISSGSNGNPDYSAGNGFQDGEDGDSAASLPTAMDFTQIAVMCLSMGFMMLGGGLFLF